jgi:hypothetical protein
MTQRGESIRVVHPLFHGEGGGSTPTSPLQLNIGEITVPLAVELNALWHSRLPVFGVLPVQRPICFGAEHEGIFYACGIWSDPIARKLNDRDWLELRRFAIAPDAPRNTASRMLRVMTLLIRRTMPRVVRLISYQDTASHTGAIYRAAGWTPAAQHNGHRTGSGWDTRERAEIQTRAPKVRWELVLST